MSRPTLPKDFLGHPVVLSIVFKLAAFLSVTDQFSLPEESTQPKGS